MYSKYCTHSEGEVKSTYVFKVLYTQGGGSEECVYVRMYIASVCAKLVQNSHPLQSLSTQVLCRFTHWKHLAQKFVHTYMHVHM